jgi:raffinose/stachyose/melibiose transport system permease protein
MLRLNKSAVARKLVFFTFVLPTFLFFMIFMFVPLIMGVPISFTDWNGFSSKMNFVGFSNYLDILSDMYIVDNFFNTIEFALYAVVFCNVFGLLIAVLLKKTSRENNLLRTIIFMPFVISLVLSAFIMSYIYTDVLYKYLGILSPLGSTKWAILGLAIIAIWRDTGYCMIIYVAALHAVPESMYEAAKIEGANQIQQFFKVTVPMIVPAFTANVILLLSWALKLFDYPMAATEGGPGRASVSVNMYIYQNIFPYYRAGYGQAIAIVWIAFIFIFTNIIATILRKREVEL